jgi:membrane-associated protein
MDRRRYFAYSSLGGVLWATGITVLGYSLGTVPFVSHNIEVILILIVLISVVPMVVEALRARGESRRAATAPGSGPSTDPVDSGGAASAPAPVGTDR